MQSARRGYMRGSSLCHQRLEVGRGWCKAELQGLWSAGHLCRLSWAVGSPLRLALSSLGKGLPGAGDLQPIPAKTLLSASHWVLSSSATAPSLQRQPDLHGVFFMQSYSKCLELFSRCSMHTISSPAMSQVWLCMESWDSGVRSCQGIGSWFGSAKTQHLSVKPFSPAASARQWEWTQPTGKQTEPKTNCCRGLEETKM